MIYVSHKSFFVFIIVDFTPKGSFLRSFFVLFILLFRKKVVILPTKILVWKNVGLLRKEVIER